MDMQQIKDKATAVAADLKVKADEAGEAIKDKAADLADKAGDKLDEAKAGAKVKAAEAAEKATALKNDLKDKMRSE